jgi:hypothetical protein
MPHLPEPFQSPDIDVAQVTGQVPSVLPNWRFGFQDSQTAESKPVHGPRDGREGRSQQPGDVPEVHALVPEFHRLLHALRIEHPPLGAANTASIRQRSWAA